MQKNVLLKLLSIGVLSGLLLVPLAMIHGVISARQQRQAEVEAAVAGSSAGSQVLVGPVLVIPYVETVIVREVDDRKNEKVVERDVNRRAVFVPERLVIQATTRVESRYKGLYKALLHETRGTWHATFSVPAGMGLDPDTRVVRIGSAYLSFGISDPRGLLKAPEVQWNGASMDLRSGSNLPAFPDGWHAPLGPWDLKRSLAGEIRIAHVLLGTGPLAFAPVGNSMQAHLDSSWPHPNFQGSFLPRERTIGDAGFSARWEVSRFATNNEAMLRLDNRSGLDAFSVKFIEPVNIYLQAERAVKYGSLFVTLTFAAFFLIETLRAVRIHPLQYGMVGLALALFFLLTISLSEHVAFGVAYLAAGTACVGLLAHYVGHVLRSRSGGIGFGALFAMLYALLYGLLLSEDNALLLGSLLLFVALAAIMILTRKVDWYHLAPPMAKEA